MSAFLYCLPLNNDVVKVGSHLGNEASLNTRYGTYVCREFIEQKVMVSVEVENRDIFERALHRLLRRVQGLHVEKEKYKPEALELFRVLSAPYRCDAIDELIEGEPEQIVDEKMATKLRYKEIKQEERHKAYLAAIAKHEEDARKYTTDFISCLLSEILHTTVERAFVPEERNFSNALHQFLCDSYKVKMGEELILSTIRAAFEDWNGRKVTAKDMNKSTFPQVNSEWVVYWLMECKACKKKATANPKCCSGYDQKERFKVETVRNIALK